MAITVNGYIAGTDDDTDWVKDMDALKKTIKEFGIVVMGRRTYDECLKYDVFPYPDALNVVLTHDKTLLKQSSPSVIFSDALPAGILELAQKKGFEKVLVIGGGHINGSFIKAGLIDEVVLDIHPLIIADGIRLFESEFAYQKLELVSQKQINDQILQVTYKVLR